MDPQYEEMVDFLSAANAKAVANFTYQQLFGAVAGFVVAFSFNNLCDFQGVLSAVVVVVAVVSGGILMTPHLGLPIWRWAMYSGRYLVRRQRSQHRVAAAPTSVARRAAHMVEITDEYGQIVVKCWQDELTDD